MKNGVAAWESAPAAQLAEAQESVVEVTPVSLPATEPLMEAVSSKGAEISDTLLALPVPAVMLIFRYPTGSVVAFWVLTR